MNHSKDIYEAVMLQRRGFTFTEIAERLDLNRAYVVRILYYDRVRDQ